MKKIFLLLLALLMTLSLCSCSTAQSYDVTVDGTVYTVDRQTKLIQDGKNTYRYSIPDSISGPGKYIYEITYPDYSVFREVTIVNDDGSENTYTIGENGYVETKYIAGSVLLQVLKTNAPMRLNGKRLLIGLFVLLLGLIELFFPRFGWQLCTGWRFKDAEPSTLALTLHRASGIFLLVVATAVLLLPIV